MISVGDYNACLNDTRSKAMRFIFTINEGIVKSLKEEAAANSISMAELVRRIIFKHLEEKRNALNLNVPQ